MEAEVKGKPFRGTSKRVLRFVVLLSLLLQVLAFFFFDISLPSVQASPTPSVVGDSTSIYATALPNQRKTFCANGLFWVFYSEGYNMVYRTSSNGFTWSSATPVRFCTHGNYFSVWFDGTHIHYAYGQNINGGDLYYRRGTPNSDGTIGWSDSEQSAVPGATGFGYIESYVSVDSDGCPWIGYRYQNHSETNYYAYVTKSSLNNGTWSTAAGFPYQLSDTSGRWWTVTPVSLESSKVYVIYGYMGATIKGRLWNGAEWEDQEEVTTSSQHYSDWYSVVAKGNDLHLVFLKRTPYDIVYVKRAYGLGWGSEILVQSSVSSTSGPVLSIDIANGDLYCFWGGSPASDHIYFKRNMYGTWDESPTEWIDESTNGLRDGAGSSCGRLTSFYRDYEEKIGLIYMVNTASPYDIKFHYVPVYPRPRALTVNPAVGGTTVPPAGSYTYDENEVATVTAYPSTNHYFDHWEYDGHTSTDNPIEITMSQDYALTPVFAHAPSIPEFPLGLALEILLIPVIPYILWRSKQRKKMLP